MLAAYRRLGLWKWVCCGSHAPRSRADYSSAPLRPCPGRGLAVFCSWLLAGASRGDSRPSGLPADSTPGFSSTSQVFSVLAGSSSCRRCRMVVFLSATNSVQVLQGVHCRFQFAVVLFGQRFGPGALEQGYTSREPLPSRTSLLPVCWITLPMRMLTVSYAKLAPESRQVTWGSPSATPFAFIGVIGRVMRRWRQHNRTLNTVSIASTESPHPRLDWNVVREWTIGH